MSQSPATVATGEIVVGLLGPILIRRHIRGNSDQRASPAGLVGNPRHPAGTVGVDGIPGGSGLARCSTADGGLRRPGAPGQDQEDSGGSVGRIRAVAVPAARISPSSVGDIRCRRIRTNGEPGKGSDQRTRPSHGLGIADRRRTFVARSRVVRGAGRGIVADRGRATRGTAAGCPGGLGGRPARSRAPRGDVLGAGRRGRTGATAGATDRTVDAGVAPIGPAGRRAEGLPQTAADAGGRTRRRTGNHASSGSRDRSCATIPGCCGARSPVRPNRRPHRRSDLR